MHKSGKVNMVNTDLKVAAWVSVVVKLDDSIAMCGECIGILCIHTAAQHKPIEHDNGGEAIIGCAAGSWECNGYVGVGFGQWAAEGPKIALVIIWTLGALGCDHEQRN